MRYMSEREYENELKRIQRANASKERKARLKEEKKKGSHGKKKLSASKLALFIMFALMLVISVWFMYEAHRLNDLSQSYALIGIAASLSAALTSYFMKSKAENTEGGIIYETALMNAEEDLEG